jgi:hypothetical protein
MSLELTDEEAAALLRELDDIHRRRPLFYVATHQDPKGDLRQDPTGAGARALAAAPEAIRTTSGDRCAETALGR